MLTKLVMYRLVILPFTSRSDVDIGVVLKLRQDQQSGYENHLFQNLIMNEMPRCESALSEDPCAETPCVKCLHVRKPTRE